MKFRTLCVLVVVTGLSCTDPTWVCGCSPPPPGVGMVFGTVSRAGAAVAGARVDFGVRQPGCANALVARPPVVTDAGGRYRALLDGVVDSVCLKVTTRDTVTGGTATQDWVLTKFSPPSSVAPDSVRVDLALPAQ